MSATYEELLKAVMDDVQAWATRVRKDDGEIGEVDIRAYLRKHWPHAPDFAKDEIVSQMMRG